MGLDVRLNDSFDLRAVELGAIAGGNEMRVPHSSMLASSIICTGVLPSIERKRFAQSANAHSCDEADLRAPDDGQFDVWATRHPQVPFTGRLAPSLSMNGRSNKYLECAYLLIGICLKLLTGR